MKTLTNFLDNFQLGTKPGTVAISQQILLIEPMLRGVAVALVGTLLLFTQCQTLVDEEPKPASASAAAITQQTITRVDGIVTLVDCSTEVLTSGEIIQICIPAQWNGELILYARGYIPAFEPLRLPTEATLYGPLFTSAGYAFATTSYSDNGLAVQTGIQDMINLRNLFIERYGEPEEIYLTGASEGGLVTTLAIERYPELWSGGLSLCGPCGDFQRQINYYGNFRVLFDYFFPGVLPGTVVDFPQEMIIQWESVYAPAVIDAISQNPEATFMLLNVAQAPYDPTNPNTIGETVLDLLRYNLFILDAVEKLGGQPFDNTDYVYSGTGSAALDLLLNQEVQRYAADKEATKTIKKYYETSGIIKKPLVKSHTTLDPIQLIWNMTLYQNKVPTGKSSLFAAYPVSRYGHCIFTEMEALTAFAALQQKVDDQEEHPLAKVKDSDGKIVRSVTTTSELASAK
ncbi:DUF6351 family protein [Pontibacter anaerobius]|uniref:DUF6351 family protein n=1 Tax=Pontibacter anaerobius TaxID=2993940 RepID=A0ABT3RJI1_9BACT|nr:DUF6351 family protein [Pontibacter anaerobius]MCX2741720.1 DUF6351 family protein [Pontibacter anaerobius]